MNVVRRKFPGPATQGAAARADRNEREQQLGATLVRLGKLNDESIARIAELQRATNTPFTRAASSLGLVTKDDVETALGVQYGFINENEGEGRLPSGLVIVRRPRCREAEQFRAMRTRLLTSADSEKIGLFAIAACGGHKEADHVAINLAASFAQVGRRTLIVDADLRNTRIAQRFGVPAGPGLRETLSGDCDIRTAVRKTVVANLSVLTSGAASPSGHELLSRSTLALTFDYLKCAFDSVVIATAPFGLIADAQFAWASAGAAFVVSRRHEDRIEQMRSLNTALRQVNASVIGAALVD